MRIRTMALGAAATLALASSPALAGYPNLTGGWRVTEDATESAEIDFFDLRPLVHEFLDLIGFDDAPPSGVAYATGGSAISSTGAAECAKHDAQRADGKPTDTPGRAARRANAPLSAPEPLLFAF